LCGKIKLATIVKIENVPIKSSQKIEFIIHSNTMNIPQNMGPNENYNIFSPLRTRAKKITEKITKSSIALKLKHGRMIDILYHKP
jgi:hypothetical protein